MSVTVKRRDITVSEEVEHELGLTGETRSQYWWNDTVGGRMSTGEKGYMSRIGNTSRDARGLLEAAIAEQGWEIRR